MTFSNVLAGLQGHLADAVQVEDWRLATLQLDFAIEVALDALRRGDDDGVEAVGEILQAIRTRVTVEHRLRFSPGPEAFVLQLQGVARLISWAVANRRSLTAEERVVVEDEASVRILRALRDANRPRANVELAVQLTLHESVIGRKLPPLRKIGYVKSWSSGRRMVNVITSLGRLVFADALQPDAVWPDRDGVTLRSLRDIRDQLERGDPKLGFSVAAGIAARNTHPPGSVMEAALSTASELSIEIGPMGKGNGKSFGGWMLKGRPAPIVEPLPAEQRPTITGPLGASALAPALPGSQHRDWLTAPL